MKQGRHAEEDFYLEEYRQYLARDARRRAPLSSYNSSVVYPKGALVLEMLKQQLGAERFWAAINRYLTRHAYATATSDDLRQAVLDATGQSLDWFWSQWIYQAGHPRFEVSAVYDSSAAALILTVRQTQVDTTPPDTGGVRFTTPLVFRAPMAIRVGTRRRTSTSRSTASTSRATPAAGRRSPRTTPAWSTPRGPWSCRC